ncbi:MAG: hypothetical protein K1X78_01215 [Verrucomicrobiaceae bacterium]|nr:hypothetical protein [Verrucomicrobiaceae bacterium]
MNTVSAISDVLACATCRPDAGSRVSLAQGNAILFMLILLAFVLGTFIYTIISFARKQQRLLATVKAQGGAGTQSAFDSRTES